jgi:putative aldouronate transport system substrate-binding protein
MKKSTLLAFCMVALSSALAFAGGGSQAPSGGGAVTLDPNDGPLTPYREPVTVNVMRENNTDIWFPDGETIRDNVLTRFYKEKLNIVYNVKWTAERGQMARQLDLAIAANDLPDMFEVNPSQVYRLAIAGQIEPLTAYYNKYVVGPVKADYEYNNSAFLKLATVNGELYAVPESDDFAGRIPLMYIRQDWLDKLGLQAPTNMQEFLAVCDAFVNRDPDGNGRKDTWAMAIDNNLGNSFDIIANAFAHYPNQWDDYNGKLAYTDIQESVLKPLDVLRDMYRRGYIDPQFAVKDGNKVAEDIAADRIGIVPGVFWTPLWQPQMNKKANPNAEWAAYPMLKNDRGAYNKPISDITCYRFLVVRKGYAHPEAAFKSNNLWRELWRGQYSEFYHGSNQAAYNKAQEDFKYYPPFWYDPPLKNYEVNIPVRAAWNNNRNLSQLTDQEGIKHFKNFIETIEGRAPSLTGWSEMIVRLHSFEIIEKIYGGTDSSLYHFTKYTGPVDRVISEKQPLVDKVRLEFLIRYIMNEDSDFQGFVRNWLRAGGQDMTDDVNVWYTTNK